MNGRTPLTLPDAAPLAVPSAFPTWLDEAGVSLEPAALAQVANYLGRLLSMNEQMNLTAVRSEVDVWERHALDALTLLPMLRNVPAGARLVDVGSGSGVPGILLAIARPDLHVALVEATQKKAAFLTAVSLALSLENVEVYPERAEHLGAGALAKSFDIVVARAVARLPMLLQWTLPFIKSPGRLLFIKGKQAAEELREASSTLKKRRIVASPLKVTRTGTLIELSVP